MSAAPPPTLRALLSLESLALRLTPRDETREDETAARLDDALERPIRWVHSSDLADPTPFLTEDVVLLTTGAQLSHPDDVPGYVARLIDRGVIGLGFGTGIVHAELPIELVAACAAHGLPLFDVPYATPFLAIARAVADAIAAQLYARRSWALAAQKAIALAALRPDGLGATLSELGIQLGARVGLFDANGTLLREHPVGALDRAEHEALAAHVTGVLHRGSRAASAFRLGEDPVVVHTLGRGGHLRGALAIVGAELDEESRGLVTSVIAMAGLALEQNEGLNRARHVLRTGLLRVLLEASPELTRRIAQDLWGGLPEPPLLVAAAALPPVQRDAVSEWLELRAERHRGRLFFAPDEEGTIIVVSREDEALFDELVTRFDARLGVSRPCDYGSFAAAHRLARTMRARASIPLESARRLRPDRILTAFANDADEIAKAVLAPLVEHDERAGTALVRTLEAYLSENGAAERAARALAVHRHTVRARITQIEEILEVDLSSFPVRAELWTALQLRR